MDLTNAVSGDVQTTKNLNTSDLIFCFIIFFPRVDNPYIQMLSSQDNLDGGPRSPSASLQSPPSDHSTFSPTLSEVHAHLIRSPPPISWPMQAHERRYYPVSPRSTGTFSPDSSDGLELVNPLTVRETASRRQSHTFFSSTTSQTEHSLLCSPHGWRG